MMCFWQPHRILIEIAYSVCSSSKGRRLDEHDVISKWMFQKWIQSTFYRTGLTIPDVVFCRTNYIDTTWSLCSSREREKKPGLFRISNFLIHIMAQMVLRVRSLSILFHCAEANKNQLLDVIQRIGWLSHSEKKGTNHINTYQIHYQCDKSVCVCGWVSEWSNLFVSSILVFETLIELPFVASRTKKNRRQDHW